MEIPRHWRLKDARLRMQGLSSETGKPVFPPRPISLDDGSRTFLHPDFQKQKAPIPIDIPQPVLSLD